MIYRFQCVIYHFWHVIYYVGVWHIIFNVWYIVFTVRYIICGMCYIVFDGVWNIMFQCLMLSVYIYCLIVSYVIFNSHYVIQVYWENGAQVLCPSLH